jgi:sugar O-acyltransferase (sialic acid O-acetyltransferase NeuD family)
METIELARLLDRQDIVGILDDDVAKHGSSLLGVPILGSIEAHSSYPESKFINCIASVARPGSRLVVSKKMNIDNERFATLVHPSASISPSVTLGSGSIILASCVLTADITVGNQCVLMPFVVLTHENRVDDGVTFGSGAKIAGQVQIGEGAYIGSGALVRERIKIGEYSVIGMGTVVLEDVPAGQVWIGNPARFLRPV